MRYFWRETRSNGHAELLIGVVKTAQWISGSGDAPSQIAVGVDCASEGRWSFYTEARNTASYLIGQIAVIDRRGGVFYTSSCDKRPIIEQAVDFSNLEAFSCFAPLAQYQRSPVEVLSKSP
jgi:hypothetical protein